MFWLDVEEESTWMDGLIVKSFDSFCSETLLRASTRIKMVFDPVDMAVEMGKTNGIKSLSSNAFKRGTEISPSGTAWLMEDVCPK